MGIPNLNKLLTKKCQKSITKCHLKEIENKKIVIDSSIYLYKFAGQNKLIENFYAMISLLLYYNIQPIFIFDGKPPKEKKQLIKERKQNKDNAENKYNELQNIIEANELSKDEIKEINSEMKKLKSQFVRIKESDINSVKTLLNLFGVEYYDAYGEADILCAQLVNTGIAWGCMSEDTDLFVYGCDKVIRYLSITNHNIMIYDLEGILDELNVDLDDFRKIMVLSGTDYNLDNKTSLNQTMQYYDQYRNSESDCLCFYEWLVENTKYIQDIDTLKNIIMMFQITEVDKKNCYVHHNEPRPVNRDELKKFLNSNGFIFL